MSRRFFTMFGKLALLDPETCSGGGDSEGNTYSLGDRGRTDSAGGSYTSRRGLVVSGSLGNICDTYASVSGNNSTSSTAQAPAMSSTGTTTNSSTSATSIDQHTDTSLPRVNSSSQQSSSHAEFIGRRQIMTTKANGRKADVNGYPANLSNDQVEINHKRHSFRNMLRKKKKTHFGYHLSYSANDVSRENDDYTYGSGSMTSFHSVSPSLASNKTMFQSQQQYIDRRKPAWTSLRRRHIRDLLCLLWMASARTFLRQGRLDEALKAVEEAEKVNWTTEPKVWCLLGQVKLGQSKRDEAIEAFQKGLVADPTDTDCRLWLAKTYMEMDDMVISEGILNSLIQGKGWNSAESWYYLGDLYSKTDRMARAKDCLFYALELEDTQPIHSFTILPRCI
ncbi:unnamed protein product [Absidia cylindrospora]